MRASALLGLLSTEFTGERLLRRLHSLSMPLPLRNIYRVVPSENCYDFVIYSELH